MSRTHKDRPRRLREVRENPRSYWSTVLNRWCLPYGLGLSAPRWYVEHVWHNPERVRERSQLTELVKEYNANGEVADGDFAEHQARHCASWYYW